MKNSKRNQLISITVLVVIVLAGGIYLSANADLLHSLSKLSAATVVMLIIFRTLFVATNGLFLQAFAAKFGVDLTVTEWFGLAVVTAMGNYITPFSGGMVIRATYLKRKHAFPYTQFLILLTSNYLVAFWVIGVVGLVTLMGFIPPTPYFWPIAFLFVGVIAGVSLLVVMPTVHLPTDHRLSRIINNALEGWRVVKSDKNLLVRLVIYTLINILLNGVSFWLAYQALDFSVTFAAALLISLMAVFSIFLNVTPGNLGIQEAVVGLSSSLLGMGVGEGLVVALIVRATTLIPIFILGPIFSYILTHRLMSPQSLEQNDLEEFKVK
ncbi:MAG: flippase-like domain-containing protein [Anaerolineae bacterium]|nr:flippase-like domain-containing protein [Anaerolineae bacterium]